MCEETKTLRQRLRSLRLPSAHTPHTSHLTSHSSPASGFTLIEIVVVMLLLGIILAMASLNVGGDKAAELRREAERLALLLRTVQQEAILQGQVFAIGLKEETYSFLKVNDRGKLAPLENDDLFRQRTLPAGITITAIEIDGAIQEKQEEDELIGIVFVPSGELPVFDITLSKDALGWHVEGSPNGEIKATAPQTRDDAA